LRWQRFRSQQASAYPNDCTDAAAKADGENQRDKKKNGKQLARRKLLTPLVAGGGIEPPTLGL